MLHSIPLPTGKRTAPVSGTFGNLSDYGGITITAGVNSSYGSWTVLAGSSDVQHDGFLMLIFNFARSASQLHAELTIGVDPAGGTSYVEVVTDLLSVSTLMVLPLYLFVKAGSSVAVKARVTRADLSTVTTRALVEVHGVSNPDSLILGSYSEVVGRTAVGRGTDVTGTAGNWSSWTLLGTLSRRASYVAPILNVYGTAAAGGGMLTPYYVELAVGDGTNYVVVGRTSSTNYNPANPLLWDYTMMPADLPAGASLYARGYNGNANQFVEVEALAIG